MLRDRPHRARATAEKIEQIGLDQIISVVREEDRLATTPTGDVKKVGVTQCARRSLDRGATLFREGTDVGGADFDIQAVLFGQLSHESRISRRGTSAQAVIDVADDQPPKTA